MNSPSEMWYSITNEEVVFTPSVLIYQERVRSNLQQMIELAGGTSRLRPHVKTHKIPELIALQIELGIEKFKCATLSELEMVAKQGGKDILLAYPLLGPAIEYFLTLCKRFPSVKFAVTVDSYEAATALNTASAQAGLTTAVFVDLDNGMHRTGIAPKQALQLIQAIQTHKNLEFSGLHVYDGHIHSADFGARKQQTEQDFKSVEDLVATLQQQGISVGELACGGTPTFPVHAQYPDRTLCPGTPVFWDEGYTHEMPELKFQPAAVIATRVISKPNGYICFDLGYKALASEMPHPRLRFLDLPIEDVINHSEEHLVIKSKQASELSIGQLVYGIPKHVCPTIALHERVYVVNQQEVVKTWQVAARKRIY